MSKNKLVQPMLEFLVSLILLLQQFRIIRLSTSSFKELSQRLKLQNKYLYQVTIHLQELKIAISYYLSLSSTRSQHRFYPLLRFIKTIVAVLSRIIIVSLIVHWIHSTNTMCHHHIRTIAFSYSHLTLITNPIIHK